MHTTIGIWSLVLGGVLIPGADSSVDRPGQSGYQSPTVTFETPGLEPGYPGSAGQPPGYPGGEPGYLGRRPAAPTPGQERGLGFSPTPPPLPFGDSSQANRQSTPQDLLMPFAPTDPSAASGAFPWGPPTAGSSPTDQAPGEQPLVGGSPSIDQSRPRLPGASAYARPRAGRPAYQARAPYDSFATQQARIAKAGLPGSTAYSPQASLSKPFTGYRRAPSTSPYMELNRIDYGYNVIDPYNQYVKPRLEQERERQQVGRQIQGLQHSVRNLGRQTQSLQGFVIPQYYMNHGSYYPGFNR